MDLLIFIFISLFNLFKSFNFNKIYSYNEMDINLNQDKNYIIFEYNNSPKEIYYPYCSHRPIQTLYIIFKEGNQINTIIDIYYNKEKIQINNSKFINSFININLYNKNKIWFQNMNSTLIYIVISNFKSSSYKDTITVYNNMEYYDISNIEQFKYNIYNNKEDDSICYNFIGFSINNTNLNYSYFHYQDKSNSSKYYFINDENEYINEEDNYISLKESKNKMIYFMIWFQDCLSEYIPIIFTYSNYSTLYPLSNIENRTFYAPILNYATKYIFIDISEYPQIFYFNINHEMYIEYYFFETNDFETIESIISSLSGGEEAIIEHLSFSIERNDNKYIGLLLAIETSSDIFFSIDFPEEKEEEREVEKEEEEKEKELIKGIYSFNENNITLNKDQRFIIFKFFNNPKNIRFPNFYPTELFHIIFKKGNKINTKINIYYNKEEIKLEGTKFINSTFDDDLYNKNKIWVKGLKSGIIYIIVSNFQNDIEDTITVFNNMEYYDISKIGLFKFNLYSKTPDYFDCYNAIITFSINNTNLNYSYLHFQHVSYRNTYFMITDESKSVYLENDYIPLNKYKNRMIYILI